MALKSFYVYIMCSERNGTLYVGITGNLVKRMYQHKNNLITGFTAEYSVHQLVYYEMFASSVDAITREKQLKHWKRDWKIQLIEKVNSEWIDLSKYYLPENI